MLAQQELQDIGIWDFISVGDVVLYIILWLISAFIFAFILRWVMGICGIGRNLTEIKLTLMSIQETQKQLSQTRGQSEQMRKIHVSCPKLFCGS